MDSMLSLGPVVKRETRTLWQLAEVGGQQRAVEFTQTLLWVRESTADLRMCHGSAIVKHLTTFNDWNGFLSAPESALSEVPRHLLCYQIRPGDLLRLEIAITVEDLPRVEDRSTYGVEWNNRAERKRYLCPPSDWLISPEFDAVKGWSFLRRVPVLEEEVIYSTATADESAMLTRLAELKAAAAKSG